MQASTPTKHFTRDFTLSFGSDAARAAFFVNRAFSASGVATDETTMSRMTAVKYTGVHNADLQALLGNDQRDLAAGHHADADL